MKTTVKQHLRSGHIVHKHARQLPLKFYSMKDKKKFTTDQYTVKTKSGRKFAVAKGPSGSDCYRIMPTMVVKGDMEVGYWGMHPDDVKRMKESEQEEEPSSEREAYDLFKTARWDK